jgi:hypothetical protein
MFKRQIYGLSEQLTIGEGFEEIIDNYCKKYYLIKKVTMTEQQQGFDRYFIADDRLIKVEYKTDLKAIKTGNLFVEIWSVIINDNPVKRGWAYTSQSDYILELVGKNLYVMPTIEIRSRLEEWQIKYPKRRCDNEKYQSEGVLVPLDVIKILFQVRNIDG